MYLQRLVAHKDTGFNYDAMGYAEFQNGVTARARAILATLNLNKEMRAQKARFFVRHNRMCEGPIDVFVFGSAKTIQDIGIAPPAGTNAPYDLMITADKSSARLDNPNILAWMSVNTDQPILIIRADGDNLVRGDKFLQPFMNQILAAEKNDDQHESYTFENGWSLRRTFGPVVLPNNDGIPIEGNGFWVMFDGNGNPVDRDKYFNDITERLIEITGEPIPVGREQQLSRETAGFTLRRPLSVNEQGHIVSENTDFDIWALGDITLPSDKS